MADTDETKAEVAAEKAYAAASEAVGDKIVAPIAESPATESVAVESVAPVEFPAKPKRDRKPADAAPADALTLPVKPQAKAEPATPVELKPKVPRLRAPATKVIKATKSATKPAPKPSAKRAAAKPAKAVVAKARPAAKPAPKIAKPAAAGFAPSIPFLAQLKEIPMDVTASIKDAVNGAQEKAKDAFAKTSAAASEYGEFAKGNVEAFVESGKILASGLQELGNGFVADSKTAFETATADVKAFAAIKSPTDLFKLQTELLRRNFDTAIAYSTKTGEAVAKLTNEAFAPIGGRVTLAVEKLKKAA